jgi:epoxide hydrolase-like predicted phosphatase
VSDLTQRHRVRALVFDVGGVLVQLDWKAALAPWDERRGGESGAVLNELFRGIDDTVLIGRRPADEHWREAAIRLGLTAAQLAELMDDLDRAERFNTELELYIAGLRDRYRTAIVSNGWTDRRTAWLRPRLDLLVDIVVISAEVGVAKPAARIFEIALGRLGVDPGEAVFVDDQQDMLAAAATVGLRTIHYRSNEQLLRELEPILTS